MPKKKLKREIVHFTVTGEFVTGHARNLWTEEEIPKALHLLTNCVGLSQSQAIDVCTGSAKLIGVNTVQLKKDRQKKAPNGMPLESLAKMMDQMKAKYVQSEKDHRETVRIALDQGEELEDLKASKRTTGTKWIEAEDPIEKPKKRPKPKPDKTMRSTNGWLSPDGLLYGCNYWGHDQLLFDLGLESEFIIEKKGWIKLQQSTWYTWMVDDAVTQRQFDTIFDWHQTRKQKMPPGIEVK